MKKKFLEPYKSRWWPRFDLKDIIVSYLINNKMLLDLRDVRM